MKSGSSAALIFQRRLSDEHRRLPLIDFGHLPAARGEALLDPVDDRLIDLGLQTKSFDERVAREVVLSGTEAAGGDEDVRVVDAEADLGDEVGQAIADDA